MLEFQSYHGNCILKLHPIYEFENFVNIAFFQCKKISQCYVDKHFFNVNRLGLKINFSLKVTFIPLRFVQSINAYKLQGKQVRSFR